ncbi:MAG: hypothetical protein ACOZF2_13975 [Thermodesulfobacteriota bacterium]
MLLNALEEWWGDKKIRTAPHQGLDLCLFEDTAGQINNVKVNLTVPAPFVGEIVKIEKDFLGQSIFIRHDIFSEDSRQLFTALGHTHPFPATIEGKKVAAGEPLALIAAVPPAKNVLPHLHLTFAWIPVSFNPERLTWRNLAQDPQITLLDPFLVLADPHEDVG